MDDLRGDFLGPPHGTTPAAIIANKNQNLDPLRAANTLMRKVMGFGFDWPSGSRGEDL